MSSFFSAIANLFRRLLRPTHRSESATYRQRNASGAIAKVGLHDFLADDGDVVRTDVRHPRPETQAALVPKQTSAPADLRRLVYQATYGMSQQRMHAGQFGSRLRKADPTFSYEKYDFTKLIDLLEAVPDIVILERVNNPGAAPAYYVRPVVDIRAQLTQTLALFDSEDGWVHVDSVIAALSISLQTYGFSQPAAFLRSCSDLVEFKPDNAVYIRLRQRQADSARPKLANSSNRPHLPVAAGASMQRGRPIVHLSKFAGFSSHVLNQKVSELAAIALPERWYFGPQPPDNFAYPILKSYLRYTFIRLQHERKVITSANGQYRAFNTGILDQLLRPIYALLSPSPVAEQSPSQKTSSQKASSQQPSSQKPWDLVFCVPGEGPAGKMLVANFTELPTAANYLSNPAKVFYHLSAGMPDVDWNHIVKDNMERLPSAFLARYAPANFTYQNTQTLVGSEFHTYKKSFAAALDADPVAYRNIVNRLKEALSRTLLKTQINYKTAVPTYYPNINSIDLLLPICLVTEDVADCAIVARQSDSGKYIGHTILTMRQAYNNARLICKLDEHWLSRAMTLSQADFEEDDDDSEEFESAEVDDNNLPAEGRSLHSMDHLV